MFETFPSLAPEPSDHSLNFILAFDSQTNSQQHPTIQKRPLAPFLQRLPHTKQVGEVTGHLSNDGDELKEGQRTAAVSVVLAELIIHPALHVNK